MMKMVEEPLEGRRPSRTNSFELRLRELVEATTRGDLNRIVNLLEIDPELLDTDVAREHKRFKLGEAGTPLHVAAWCGHIKVAEYLLDLGADINKKDRWGRTPLHYAQEAGGPEMREFLVGKGADIDLWLAAIRGDIPRLTELLEEDPDQANAKPSPLEGAAFGQQVEGVARLLISYGAKALGRNNGMFAAIAVNNPPFVRVLLDCGADPTATGHVEDDEVFGGTLLHWATRMRYTHDNSESVRLLLERGAKVNALDTEGKTPLDLASAQPTEKEDPHPSAPRNVAKRYDKLAKLFREFGGKTSSGLERTEETSQ